MKRKESKYELIFKTPREVLQPFFIELAIFGGYDELLYIYDKQKKDVEMYLSSANRIKLARVGLKLFYDGKRIEKLLQKEYLLSQKFNIFLATINLTKVKATNKIWIKNILKDYYHHFVEYSNIYRFTESFYSPLVDQTIKTFISENIQNKNLVNYFCSLLLNSSEKEKVTKKRKEILFSLKADNKFIQLCDSVRKIGKAKLAMRTKLDNYWDFLEKFLEKIAKLLMISSAQIKSLFYSELLVILTSPKISIDRNTLDKANRRNEFFVAQKVSSKYIYYTGLNARNIANSVRPEIKENIAKINGDIASEGYAKGRVIILPVGISKEGKEKLKQKMTRMEYGDIVVAENIGPEMITVCHKATAMVADEGGINSHAAIISRELEIPSIVNTKIATKVLCDGDLVEIDANKGIIKNYVR